MQVINLSRPGEEPVTGDQIRIVYPNGSTETKYFTAQPEAAPNE